VIATFADFNSAVEFLHTRRCDVLVADDSFPRSVKLINQIKKLHEVSPGTAILLVLQTPVISMFQTFLDHGVRAILHRSDSLEHELPNAIVLIRQGGTYFSSAISRLRDVRSDKNTHLSPRDIDILRLTLMGYNVKEVSAQVDLCHKSVYRDLRDMRTLLGAQSNAQLIVMAQQLGLLLDDEKD
jgi:two-component system capsular synthesis response regulator RcsB